MRSEREMLDLILNTARQDERIRAVIMNGSRANPGAAGDIFQDYDIVYIVSDVNSFKNDPDWIDCFGERMILQLPDDMDDPPPMGGDHYAYLMQFSDGNRIDLGIFPAAKLNELEKDSLSVLLLDKDGIIGSLPPADESGYLPKPPTAKQYADCCNEFWWVSPYVAKGLWREEITYAKVMLDQFVRDQLMKMLTWYIGVKTEFSINPGKFGKYYEKYLEPELWEMLLKTYADASYDSNWQALFAMGELFRKIALQVADHFGYEYPTGDDEKVSAHMRHVRSLPKDAKEIY
jgi:aminoglycoside 6-adenylyltransferase